MSAAATTSSLRQAELLAADAIGDVIEHWGFRKALGRVWTVAYLAGEPLAAPDLCERLQMSTGAVSMALTELQRWGVMKRVWRPGERREFYEAETDFWTMISRVVRERERFLANSVRDRLARAVELLREAPPSAATRTTLARARSLLSFAMVAVTVIDSFIASQHANFSEFGNLLEFARRARKGRRA